MSENWYGGLPQPMKRRSKVMIEKSRCEICELEYDIEREWVIDLDANWVCSQCAEFIPHCTIDHIEGHGWHGDISLDGVSEFSPSEDGFCATKAECELIAKSISVALWDVVPVDEGRI